MTDLERVKEYYDWLKEEYVLEESDDIAKREGADVNQRLIVGRKGDWYWAYYIFKDGKLVNRYLTE